MKLKLRKIKSLIQEHTVIESLYADKTKLKPKLTTPKLKFSHQYWREKRKKRNGAMAVRTTQRYSSEAGREAHCH